MIKLRWSRPARWTAAVLFVGLLAGVAPMLAACNRSDGDLEFKRDGYQLHGVSAEALPSKEEEPAPLVDAGQHDDQGVRMFKKDDKLWDHPVAQAQWALRNLTSWEATNDRRYLDRAIANAQRNLDRRVESRGAWWYPYEFDLTRCKGRPVIKATWYSGMSQGQLLSVFVRLFEETGDAKWKEAADKTFLSLTLPPDEKAPWAVWTDPDGYLWLEEYPESDALRGERVMNGHIFSMFGVYDYWRITKDSRAVTIFDGAASTVRRYLPSKIRVEDWASRYSIKCTHNHVKYHQVHTRQTLSLYGVTHAPAFAELAYNLRSDYPVPDLKGTVQFEAGTHKGYTFDVKGAVTGEKSASFSKPTRAAVDQRIRVRNRGIYYRVTGGALAGYLVPEEYGQRVLLGKAVEHRYVPAREIKVAPGSYTAYAYDDTGKVVGSKEVKVDAASTFSVQASAWVNGRLSYEVTSGDLTGHWLPHDTGITFS
ncbi:D-glucuronyl C5-epimerase family protein [Micromonospora sp. NPDC023966]|uniref:D-glucuronyl C5-epimerase family protein n=1 Tax=Micromonospora sp. NPDC023966 TaxID=3154699 RepID=UPI0033C9F9BD